MNQIEGKTEELLALPVSPLAQPSAMINTYDSLGRTDLFGHICPGYILRNILHIPSMRDYIAIVE